MRERQRWRGCQLRGMSYETCFREGVNSGREVARRLVSNGYMTAAIGNVPGLHGLDAYLSTR
jgi:hypothetical protein